MSVSTNDDNDLIAWRNLVTQWHLNQGMPDCGCDDDTPDTEYCQPSIDYADRHFASRPDPSLDGEPDPWTHDVWIAAWGRNAPLIASASEFRLPMAPVGMSWLATRILVKGRAAVELFLLKLGEHKMTTVARARTVAEPSTVAARARQILVDLTD